jgi:hypothetical protein
VIDEEYVDDRTERVRMLLEAGVDVNVRVRGREYGSVLDKEGVSVLERTRRRVGVYSRYNSKYGRDKVTEYKKVRNEIRRHVRRYSM